MRYVLIIMILMLAACGGGNNSSDPEVVQGGLNSSGVDLLADELKSPSQRLESVPDFSASLPAALKPPR